MHVRRLPSGHYRVFVQHGGRKLAGTKPTKLEAEILGGELLKELGAKPDPLSDVTVADMLDRHLKVYGPKLSPTTLAEYARVADRLDSFGERSIRSVRSPDIDTLYQRLEMDGWAVGAIRRLHELMHAAWRRTAIFHGWADYNPVSSVRKPARAPHDITPPDPATVKRILDAADDQFRLFVRLAATTGARRGELVALQWGDKIGPELTITRSLVYTPDTGTTVRQTKTGVKGQRRIALDIRTSDDMIEHLGRQVEMADRNGLPDPMWVFSHDAGVTPWFPTTPTAMFGKLREKLGVEGVRLHDLRHYVATRMLAAGESPAQVAARLGHSNPHTTMRTYAHWLPARDRNAAAVLGAELD